MNYIFAIGCYILKISRDPILFAVQRVQNMTDKTKRDDKTVMRQKRRTGDINSESCVPETPPCRAQSYEYKHKHKYKYKYMCTYRYEKNTHTDPKPDASEKEDKNKRHKV